MDGNLTIRRVALRDLYLDPANVRSHDERNLDAIAARPRHFGQAPPLVMQRGTGGVIGGNGRLVAIMPLDWTDCDVVELDLDDTQAMTNGSADGPCQGRSVNYGALDSVVVLVLAGSRIQL